MSLPAVNTPPFPLSTNAPMAGVALGRFEGLDQRVRHRAGDRDVLLRPGEGRRHYRAVPGDLDVFGHLNLMGHALTAGIGLQNRSGVPPDTIARAAPAPTPP